MAKRSSIEKLDPAIVAQVHDAIKRGCTIDQIVGQVRALGAPVSRSAVGRYTKDFAELAKQQRDMRAVAEAFGKEFGEDDRQGRMMVQLLTSVITRAIMPIAQDDDIDLGGKEMHFLARAVKDTMSAAKLDVDTVKAVRAQAEIDARRAAASDAVEAGRAAGATEETLDVIRKKILGLA